MAKAKGNAKGKDNRKVHLEEVDGYVYGWNRTMCGRRITDRILTTPDGVDAATCESCRNLYDFGTLTR